MPVLVISGAHLPAIDRLCDVLAGLLEAQHVVIGGRGHAIPRADGFNDRLTAFWSAAEAAEEGRV